MRLAIPGRGDGVEARLPPRAFLHSLAAAPAVDPSILARQPRVSIVMPTYNQAAFIERSLLSVLNQGYANLELIVVDGGSTDGTVDILRRHAARIAHRISERDQGQSDALNKGFALATGEVFGWLNSDDLYLPGALHEATRALAAHPRKGIVYGDWLAIDADDRLIAHERAFDFSLGQFKYEGFHLNAQSMFWRREVHERFGQFDLALYNTMDYDMILRFGLNEGAASFLRLPTALGCFRRHAQQKTQGFDERVLGEQRRIAERHGYVDKYRWPGLVKRFGYRFRRAWWYYKRGGVGHLVDRLVHGQP